MAGELGHRIRQARHEAGFTNAESLAVALGVGVRTIQRYEAGEREPSIRRLIKIAELTGKPLDFFLQDEALELERDGATR